MSGFVGPLVIVVLVVLFREMVYQLACWGLRRTLDNKGESKFQKEWKDSVENPLKE